MSQFVITHDGNFHVDEILAIAMLKRIYPDLEILRTRDYSLIEDYVRRNKVLAVVDVYGRYDGELYFDHHQSGFNTSIDLLCSSAGLVFLKYGDDLISNQSKFLRDCMKREIYEKYIKYVDAQDNGIDVNSYVGNVNPERIFVRSLSTIVSDCTSFEMALEIIRQDFDNFLNSLEKWAQDYEEVYEKLNCLGINEEILFTNKMNNVTKLVCEIEKRLGMDIKFVINSNKVFSIYAVPETVDSFKSKIPLCEDWRGLRDAELSRVTGIEGCVYVHATGFLGINQTLEGAIAMCKVAMKRHSGKK